MKQLFWLTVNLIGFLILFFMYNDIYKTHANVTAKGNIRQKLFEYLQIVLMLYIIFDSGMYLINGMSFQSARIINYAFSMLYYLITPLPGLMFLMYCDYRIYNDESGIKRRFKYYLIPIIINTLAVLSTPFTNMLFIINENNVYSRGDYMWITIIISFGYLVSYILLTVKTVKKHTVIPKGSDIYIYLSPIAPIIFAIIQLILSGPLLLGFGFVISAYFLYTNNIESSEDKRRLFVRLNKINIAHFALVSFLMTAGLFWTLENIIKEIKQEYDSINQTNLLLPFIIMTILFVLFVFSSNRITQRLIFTPLKMLVNSLLRLKESNTEYNITSQEIYGIDRDDEIGLLSNTIKDLFIKGHYDELTGIFNRRYMESTMKQIITMLSRTDIMLSVMLLDIDYFKKYNDTYGHNEGDSCLRIIAQTISNTITRKGDFAARYGGEEFAVILPGTDEAGSLNIANKILNAIRELKIPHAESPNGIVTISIGITTGNKNNTQNWNNYLIKADEALYMSKNNGRNRLTLLSLNESITSSAGV